MLPIYEQKAFAIDPKQSKLWLVASRDGRDSVVTIHQDLNLYAGLLAGNEQASYQVEPNRSVWLHVAQGEIAYAGGSKLELSTPSNGEVLLFDLA